MAILLLIVILIVVALILLPTFVLAKKVEALEKRVEDNLSFNVELHNGVSSTISNLRKSVIDLRQELWSVEANVDELIAERKREK